MAHKGERNVTDLHEINGVYQLSLPPLTIAGPRTSLITGTIILPPPKEVCLLPPPTRTEAITNKETPFATKNIEPKYIGKSDYIDFGPPKKTKPAPEFDPVKLFIKCLRKELKTKKQVNKAGKDTLINVVDDTTDMSRLLKTSLEKKLRKMGLDPIKIETSFKKKALRRGGRKHAKGGWMYEPGTNSYIRTKIRPGTTSIKVHKKDSRSHYGSTKMGVVHVG